jgi:hypothetical protein
MRMFVYMIACVCVCVYACMNACMNACMYVCMYTYLYAHEPAQKRDQCAPRDTTGPPSHGGSRIPAHGAAVETAKDGLVLQRQTWYRLPGQSRLITILVGLDKDGFWRQTQA